ncbi:MAG: tetratricopeptide repeat protein [Neomegalonema sp.]|nr:tetratricopeptide repeat protein [Neomegalonema sp.]
MSQLVLINKRFARIALFGLSLVALLGGCAHDRTDAASIKTASTPGGATIDPSYAASTASAARKDPLADYSRAASDIAIKEGKHYGAVAHLTRVFRANPRDKRVAYDLARHLRYLGATTEAEQILAEAQVHHPRDPLLRLERAKARIAGGRARAALEILEPLRKEKPHDPAVLQVVGVAYDRIGQHKDARKAYKTAIDRGARSPKLLNNYALSHLLSGDLKQAIEILRRAAAAPGATPQIRHNLAMALALDGQGEEARTIAAGVSSREDAEKMVSYFERMAAAGATPADAWAAAAKR